MNFFEHSAYFSNKVLSCVLPGGLKVFIIDTDSPITWIDLNIPVGWLNEGKIIGMAHFLEHMIMSLFDGLTDKDKELVLSRGADLQAFTSYYCTTFRIKGSVCDTSSMIGILWEIVFRSLRTTLFEEKSFEAIRQEIFNESDLTSSASLELNQSFLSSLVYPHCKRMKYSSRGTLKDIETIDLSQTLSFFDRYYKKHGACLCISGDLSKTNCDSLIAILREIDPDLFNKTRKPLKRRIKNFMPKSAYVDLISDLEELDSLRNGVVKVEFYFSCPAGNDKELIYLRIALQMLFNFRLGLLMRKCRFERKMLYEFGIEFFDYPVSRIQISFTTNYEDVQGIMDYLTDYMSDIVTQDYDDKLLRGIIAFMRNECLTDNKTCDADLSLEIIRDYWLLDRQDEIIGILEVMDDISKDCLSATVKRYFTSKTFGYIIIKAQ